ncbi:3-hydroxyacyl-CoA dehydrogenase type-2-like [Contarinia nasturtii]|uniref:3-hydroxyacyl-CoA dehydrogenase type-2-like n=1 Tax=Contarinia nasturtii TaxID=265458 RepID=UPI0012D38508|nr:3-hydroxyacyl-CoA dehydrogenase type-2-like [Contarinia nasturtii]
MFKNLVTLVTGGASGLGRATVNRFVKKGSQVIICDLPTSKGEQVAKEIGENVQFIPADVMSERDIENLADEISKKYGKLDVLVNCAGVSDAHLTYNFNLDLPKMLKDFEDVLMTNVGGTINVIRLTAQLFANNQPDEGGLRGVIINTSGVEAFNGIMGQTSIAAASGAIHSMTKPLAEDFARTGIRVVTISPGFIRSPMNNYFPKHLEESLGLYCVTVPNRYGNGDEFAHLVQSIVQNPYINGTTIELSGGMRMSL